MSRWSNPERPCSSCFSWILHKSFNCQTHQLIWHKHPASLQVLYWVQNTVTAKVSRVPFIKKNTVHHFPTVTGIWQPPRFIYYISQLEMAVFHSLLEPRENLNLTGSFGYVYHESSIQSIQSLIFQAPRYFLELQLPFTPKWAHDLKYIIYYIHHVNTIQIPLLNDLLKQKDTNKTYTDPYIHELCHYVY